MRFEVWAPRQKTVELVTEGTRRKMAAGPRGWWWIDAGGIGPGDEYAFSLDGGPARPDPRSMDQPRGVHAPSRVVDHAAYAWRHPSFRAPPLRGAVIYELHVGTFTEGGTFDSAAERLGHLVSLGVTHVEVMPINAFEGERGWGYDGVCWFSPHRAYTGRDGPDAVKRFVDACHGHGLAVVLDVVYNHLGPSGNYLREFGPYFSDAYATPWGDAMNLDGPGSDETRRLIVDNALMWLGDYRFDGLRLDAVHAFHDRSAVHLLEELSSAVDVLSGKTGRPLCLIAESDLNDPRVVTPRESGGLGIDAQWSDDFHHALHALLTGERGAYYADFGSVADLAKAYRQAFVADGVYSGHRDRRHGRRPIGVPAHRFLAYSQDHDQVGNRALGDRPSDLLSEAALRLSAALVLLSPFTPMLFQGEEWGTRSRFQYFTDHRDPELARSVREGRRREFEGTIGDAEQVPDPQSPDTFRASGLAWEELDGEQGAAHRRMLEWYRQLIIARRRYGPIPFAATGEAEVSFSESPPWLVLRWPGHLLAFNLGSERVRIGVGGPEGAELVVQSGAGAAVDQDSVTLGGWGVVLARGCGVV